MKLIDTHCHVHFNAYAEDAEAVILRAQKAGIGMITIGTQRETSAAALVCAHAHEDVWAAVGLHPNHLHSAPPDPDELSVEQHKPEIFDMDFYRELARDPKVVGIGETGFDAYRVPEGLTFDEIMVAQERTFRAHLDLCTELHKPVIVHCRDAHAHVARIFEEYCGAGKLEARGVLHCFTGTVAEAERYTKMGFYISLSGIATFPPRKTETENKFVAIARAVPHDRLLIETDSPYLTPPPFRGKRNEPLYVQYVANFVAHAWGVSLEEAAEQTLKNSRQLFQIIETP